MSSGDDRQNMREDKIEHALREGDIEIFKQLLPESKKPLSAWFRISSQSRQANIMNFILSKRDDVYDDNFQTEIDFAFMFACEDGNLEVVKILLSYIDFQKLNHHPIVVAAHYNRTSIIKHIIDYCDPRAHDSRALLLACLSGHRETIDILFDYCDVDSVETQLRRAEQNLNTKIEEAQYFFDKLNSFRSRKILEDELLNYSNKIKRNKIL